MKQFLSKLYRRFFPVAVPVRPVSAAVKEQINALAQLNESVKKASNVIGISAKKFRKFRLDDMYREQCLDHTTAHRIAAEYKITLHELVDYYHYFGMLPQPEHKIIIKNYGVQNLISDFENLMETV